MANSEDLELKDRLALIETMIAEGRRTTGRWGWVFVLWGMTYFVAIAWSEWGNHKSLAWNATVTGATLLAAVLVAWRMGMRQTNQLPATTVSRALLSIWLAMGISMAILLPSLGVGGRSNTNLVVAVIGTLLGLANAASSMILKWKVQFACASIWWATAIIACVGTQRQSFVALLVANFFCQIVFGIYGMVLDARGPRIGATGQGVSHA